MATASPTARTLNELRRLGYHAEVVERFNSFTKRRKDFIDCVDIIAFRADATGVLGIQCTSASGLAARVSKILGLGEAVADFLHAGNSLQCWGWRKRARPEGRRWWTANRREIRITGNRLEAVEL
jgi:hypothetical protein